MHVCVFAYAYCLKTSYQGGVLRYPVYILYIKQLFFPVVVLANVQSLVPLTTVLVQLVQQIVPITTLLEKNIDEFVIYM